jgi:3-phenylpropionate/trans-cinnamate dioxygenase ferredoxin component
MVTTTKSSEIAPGQMRALRVYDAPVLIANVGGLYYGLSDVCPHDAASLSQGRLEGTTVICPNDGSRFDLVSGNVLSGPSTVRVRTYRVQTKAGELSI